MKHEDYVLYLEQYKKIRCEVDWGDRFQILFNELNRPVSAISNIIGCSESEIIRILNRQRRPSYPLLFEIAWAFHVNCNWLFDANNADAGTNILIDKRRTRDKEFHISTRIMCTKKVLGVSDAEFLKDTGMNYRTFAKIKKNGETDEKTNSPREAEHSMTERKKINESTIYRIADYFSVGFEWLLCGDELAKENPCNTRMKDFLWENPGLRKKIWVLMKAEGNSQDLRNDYENQAETTEGTIGERINAARVENNLSISELSQLCCVSESSIRNWERGANCPDLFSMKRLSLSLNVGIDWLRKGDESQKEYPCDIKMVEFLKERPDIRAILTKEMQ